MPYFGNAVASGYRTKALEVRQLAATTTFSEIREQLLDVAKQYDQLAERAENPFKA
jgi:hypothetical protein